MRYVLSTFVRNYYVVDQVWNWMRGQNNIFLNIDLITSVVLWVYVNGINYRWATWQLFV